MSRGVHPRGATVVVTGASSGIGRAVAERFAAKGSNLTLVARSQASLAETAETCREAGAEVLVAPVDIADPDAVDDVADRTVARFGAIDVWVNDAAVMAYGELNETPVATQRRIIEVNLLGTMWGTRSALRVMKPRGRGAVINVASLYGKITTPYVTGYSSSKFGILGFSQAVREELHDHPGVSVSVVLPGAIDTPIYQHAANYTGRVVRPVPPVASPRHVARVVVRRARRPRRQTTVGQLQHTAAWGKALMPGVYGRLTTPAMRFVGFLDEPSEPHDGNVFEPQPELDAVLGGWRHHPLRNVSLGLAVPAAAYASWTAWRRHAHGR
ncbi:MAG TPA: SDR family oxidoreductase [Nocardioides sp.]|uniref:SDR family oxidoreductase n=1 Tax=Nocardioides sp. TaxID=35761 RepID=UPI002F3F0E48